MVAHTNSARIQRCETQLHDFLATFLKSTSNEALNAKVSPGKWSAHEHLAHLARYHQVFLQRIDRILAEDAPHLPRYSAEGDPDWGSWSGLSTQQMLVRLSGMRAKLIVRLRSMNEAEFHRTGVHPKFGPMDLSQWLEFFLIHEAHHLYAILPLVKSK